MSPNSRKLWAPKGSKPIQLVNGSHQNVCFFGAGAGTVPSAGKLLQRLQTEGIEAGDIDTVILTHGHPDHIGGNTDAEGKLAFPNARYIMSRDEWDFWMSGPDLAQLDIRLVAI